MSIGPTGAAIVSSLSASPLAQNASSEVDRNRQEAANQARKADSDQKAVKASGVGDPDESQEAGDRDADGRRLWEVQDEANELLAETEHHEDAPPKNHKGLDPTGQTGGILDISG
ncbi:hypothetical protein [Blastopirellula marina]|uniref:Uncharacterized protein n=1 Tax=Blastopirellula marina TaxID=124 RepID=A0A2S8GFV5_9BACT|nr:hypothetical protein [Blastopirellula marina]PQO43368.1 hypothetical protein C5Y98_00185 [Blastopirellula marina]PTL46682.1 hypothetical protein C5Y97_00185 [Blastopirellula marina]